MRPKKQRQRRKAWKERWVEKHGSAGGAWHWRVGVRDEQRTTVHQLFPPAFPFFSCFPLFIRWWFGPNSLSQLLNFFCDCWLSQQHDGRVWLLICRSCESGTQSYSCKGTAPQILLLGASYFPFWILSSQSYFHNWANTLVGIVILCLFILSSTYNGIFSYNLYFAFGSLHLGITVLRAKKDHRG